VEAVLNDVIAAINQFPVTSSQLAIFPNPVNKILSIRLPGKMSMASVTIYNFLGELIFTDAPSFDLQLNEIQIDCSSYSDGLYFIEITNGNSVYRERFVKQ